MSDAPRARRRTHVDLDDEPTPIDAMPEVWSWACVAEPAGKAALFAAERAGGAPRSGRFGEWVALVLCGQPEPPFAAAAAQ